MNHNDKRLTKNERREQAREQARLAREAEKKREKRNRLFLQGGVVIGVLAILAIVGLVLMQTLKPAGPGPQNMASGGVVIEQDLAVVPGPALESGEDRVAPEVDRTQTPLDIAIYVDYTCVHCAEFEQAYGSVLENWVGSGDATLKIYPVNILDASTGSSRYSTRAANALACVVDQNPEDGVAFNLHNTLLSEAVYTRVQENAGLSDEELVEQAERAGFAVNDEFRQCVKDVRFASFIAQNTKAATETGILGLAEGAQLAQDESNGVIQFQPEGGPQRLRGTPLVIVNGQEWRSTRDGEFEMYLAKLKAELDGNGNGNGTSNGGAGTGNGDAATEPESSENE
ncbi:MAG: DsbA family protein [Leucobacter sp.]